MSKQESEAYVLVKQKVKQEGGDYKDLRVRDGLVQVLNSEHYYSHGDDWMGVMRFSPELEFIDKFGYGHNHSPWKRMAYKFDDITHDDDNGAELSELVRSVAKALGITEAAAIANPYRFIRPLRDRFDEEYKKDVAEKQGILVKPMAFDSKDGMTFIVDRDQSTVYCYTDGIYVGRLGDRGVAPGQFLNPTDVKIVGDEIHVLDFPKNIGEYFLDKPCFIRVQRCGLDNSYLGQTILDGVRLMPSEWGQTSFEVTQDNIFVSNNNDLYIRDRDGRFVADLNFKDSRITRLRADGGILGIGCYEYGGILFLDTSTGEAKGFLQSKHPKYKYSQHTEGFDFYGGRIYVALGDVIQAYEIDHHALPSDFDDKIRRR